MAKAYSKRIKKKARCLRSKGWSIGEISLKMRIPKNTLSGWVKDIQLTKKQKERIRQKIIDSGKIGRPLAVKANREKIEKWKQNIRNKVKHFERLPLKKLKLGNLFVAYYIYAKEQNIRLLGFYTSEILTLK